MCVCNSSLQELPYYALIAKAYMVRTEANRDQILEIEAGKDYCTLVTCTPYGVNTHRLLVRGHRIETPEESVPVPADAVQVDRFLVAPVVAGILIVIIVVIGLLRRKFH